MNLLWLLGNDFKKYIKDSFAISILTPHMESEPSTIKTKFPEKFSISNWGLLSSTVKSGFDASSKLY